MVRPRTESKRGPGLDAATGHQIQPEDSPMRAALCAALLLFALPSYATTRQEALAECEVYVQQNLNLFAMLLDRRVPVERIKRVYREHTENHGTPDDYRDATLELIDALVRREGVMEAHDKAVRVCVPHLTEA